MNYKLYALLFTLAVIASPALKAMRGTHATLLAARSLGQTAAKASSNEFARFKTAHKNLSTQLQPNYHSHNNPYFLVAGSTGMALFITDYLAAQEALEKEDEEASSFAKQPTDRQMEENPPVSIENLKITNVPDVLNALAHATESDKRIVAEQVAHTITYYNVETIISMLQCTHKKPHRILVNGITKKITQYTPENIAHILKADPTNDTHDLIARAVAANYNQFTGYTFCGFQVRSHNSWRKQYVDIFHALNPAHHATLLKPILPAIHNYNLLDLLRVTDAAHHQTILRAYTTAPQINLSAYGDHELEDLLKTTKLINQANVVQAIIQNIDQYNGWHFYGMFKQCTPESKKAIIAAITYNIEHNIHTYDEFTLALIAQQCTPEQHEFIVTHTKTSANGRQQLLFNSFVQLKN